MMNDEKQDWLDWLAVFLAGVNRLGRAPRLGASGEMGLLAKIALEPGITQGPLRRWVMDAMAMKISTASLSMVVERLMGAGLIVFGADHGDRRKKGLWLSDVGRAVLESLRYAGGMPESVKCSATVLPSVLVGRVLESAVALFEGRVVAWVAKEAEIELLGVLVELGMLAVDVESGMISRVKGAGVRGQDSGGEEVAA